MIDPLKVTRMNPNSTRCGFWLYHRQQAEAPLLRSSRCAPHVGSTVPRHRSASSPNRVPAEEGKDWTSSERRRSGAKLPEGEVTRRPDRGAWLVAPRPRRPQADGARPMFVLGPPSVTPAVSLARPDSCESVTGSCGGAAGWGCPSVGDRRRECDAAAGSLGG